MNFFKDQSLAFHLLPLFIQNSEFFQLQNRYVMPLLMSKLLGKILVNQIYR